MSILDKSKLKNLLLITARSGSVDVPDKNIRNLGNGIPLIGMRIISALRSGIQGDLICSTDSENYAAVAKHYGASVPFIRPAYLASESASSVDVIIHALDWLKTNDAKDYDNIFLIEPSSPFARSQDLQTAYNMLLNNYESIDAVVSVKKIHSGSIFVCPMGENGDFSALSKKIANLKDLRRQALETEYTPNGLVYVSKVSSLREKRSFYTTKTNAFCTPDEYSIEIDTELDFLLAKTVWNNHLIDQQLWL